MSDQPQYDVELFDPYPDADLICPICRYVLTSPVCTPCGHDYCSQCIDRWLEQSSTCPTCRTLTLKITLQPACELLRVMIGQLTMHCVNAATGCIQLIPLVDYSTHQIDCPYEPMKCRWKPCRIDLIRRDKESHEVTCESRKERCPRKCQLMLPVQELDTHDCRDTISQNVERLRDKLKSKKEAMAQLECRVTELKAEKCRLEQRLKEINANISMIQTRRQYLIDHPHAALEEGEGSGEEAAGLPGFGGAEGEAVVILPRDIEYVDTVGPPTVAGGEGEEEGEVEEEIEIEDEDEGEEEAMYVVVPEGEGEGEGEGDREGVVGGAEAGGWKAREEDMGDGTMQDENDDL